MTLPEYAYRMLDELGVQERPDDRHNPKILEWHAHTTMGDWGKSRDETPWCASFQGAMLLSVGIKPTYSALARSYVRWGRKAKPDEIIGSVCVLKLKRPTRKARKSTDSGRGGYHVGTVLGVYRGGVVLVSGNKDDKVGVDPYPKSRWRQVAFRVPG